MPLPCDIDPDGYRRNIFEPYCKMNIAKSITSYGSSKAPWHIGVATCCAKHKTRKAIAKGKQERPAKCVRQVSYSREKDRPMIYWLSVLKKIQMPLLIISKPGLSE